MKKSTFILSILFLAIIAGGILLYKWQKSGGLQKIILKQVSDKIQDKININDYTRNTSSQNIFEQIAGFNKPQNYLVLFLNNTEMRPGGGFIGVYAVVQIDKGIPKVLKVEGTEILDNYSSRNFSSVPPEPLKKYLNIARLEFRDSNWSPDFASSTQKGLELYKLENGMMADKIDGVIGFTPTVVEQILAITGPITVDGIIFNSQNFTERLEYEVEYGFKNRGISQAERKKILSDLAQVLTKKLITDIFVNWQKYISLISQMAKERQVVVYSVDSNLQKIAETKNFAGRIKNFDGDYLLWVDANLGAWKTDFSIDRYLTYSVAPDQTGKYIATVKMKLIHHGKIDWRTSRYRDYARIYVPLGSKFISVKGSMEIEGSSKPGVVDKGIENNKQWFGAFIAVEPGETKELVWKYYLAPSVAKQIQDGYYNLLAQKQIGVVGSKLTIILNFGNNILSAAPSEAQNKFGDNRYDWEGDLNLDREFIIKMANVK